MIKTNIFTTTFTFILIIAGFYATKANKKILHAYNGTLYYGINKTHVSGKASTGCGTSPVICTIKSAGVFLSTVPFINGIAIGYDATGYITLYY